MAISTQQIFDQKQYNPAKNSKKISGDLLGHHLRINEGY